MEYEEHESEFDVEDEDKEVLETKGNESPVNLFCLSYIAMESVSIILRIKRKAMFLLIA